MARIPHHVRQSFRLEGPARSLPGGSVEVYRVGGLVVKPFHRGSLESPHSLQLAPWLAGHLAGLDEEGFRIARPVPSNDGRWMLDDGWTAWTFVDGRTASAGDVPAVIEAIRALHRALRGIPKHPPLDRNDGPWGFAHEHCWGSRPEWVHPVLADLVDELYARRRAMPPLERQLIHGDLNPENVLIAPGRPPGFLDLTPFWAPVDFALAMFANWIGPRRNDRSVLGHFQEIPHFDQLLIRAAIRMLLIVSELKGVEGWNDAPEKRAA